MSKVISVLAAFLFLSGAANAITIEPGKFYVGDYSFAGAVPQPAPCCPILSIDSTISAGQYYFTIGSDNLGVGETWKMLFNFDGTTLVESGPGTTSLSPFSFPVGGSGGIGIASSEVFDDIFSGQILLYSEGGSFDLNLLQMVGEVDATVDSTGGPLATNLIIVTDVTNISEFTFPDPDAVVPLPATLPFALTGLICLGYIGRRKKVAPA